MPDEWACDDCGYIAGTEPDKGKCPGCGSKMNKIEGDDLIKDDISYDDDDLATPIDEDDWEELKEIEEPDEEEDKKIRPKKAAL